MTVTVTPTVELSNVPPRIRLDVSASAGETSATVTRLDPDGRTVPVRSSDGAPLPISGTTALLYDYEMQYGAAVSYSSLQSPATVSAQVAVGESRVWLIHPGVPELSQPLTVAELSERKRPVQQGVYRPMGRRYAVVQTDGQRKAPEFTLSIYTATGAERDAVEDLLEDAGTLLLNVPAGKGWGIGADYVAVGDSTESRYGRFLGYSDRRWDLPLVVVGRPFGGTQSQRTYVDVLATYTSYTQVQAAYSSYFSLLAGP